MGSGNSAQIPEVLRLPPVRKSMADHHCTSEVQVKLHPNGREISDFMMYAEADQAGNIWIKSDDISGFAQEVRDGCKTDNNLSQKLINCPEGRFYFPARIRRDPDRADHFTVYSIEPFGDGGVQQHVRKADPANVAVVRSAFDNFKAESFELWLEKRMAQWDFARHAACTKMQDSGIEMKRAFDILDEFVENFFARNPKYSSN